MLDIRFIRDNAEAVQESTRQKGYAIDISSLLALDDKRRTLQQDIDELRTQRNANAAQIKAGAPSADLIETGKKLKADLAEQEAVLSVVLDEYTALLQQVPNVVQPDVPIGGEEDSVEIRRWGENKHTATDHLDFATRKGWLDFERGAKVAGAKFYYLKGDLALLENALTQFVLSVIRQKGFEYLSVPVLVNSRIAAGTGFAPRSTDQSDEYFIEGEDLSLIATAEIPLTGYHADEIIDEDRLPLLYAAHSPSFRKEAGAYGKHSRGLFRVHQFNKLEMYAFTTPQQSVEIHDKILAIQEEIWQTLNIPYHVINIASGDLGAPASKKYDVEYWSPVDQAYRELTSASNCTDFQARNLNIRVRRKTGEVEVLHTLNGTAVSLARTLIAVIENYQNEDGSLTIPEALRPYLDNRISL